MSETETEFDRELLDFQMHGDGYKTVHMGGSVTFITRNDHEASAYLKGVSDAMIATTNSRQKGKQPLPMKISIDETGAEIRKRYTEEIEEHTFALFAFNSSRLPGSSYKENLDNLLGKIIDHLVESPKTKKVSISFFIHPLPIDWEGSSGPALCIYIGSNDDTYSERCLHANLNRRLMKMQSYVCAEGYSPDDAPLYAYYDPASNTFHIAREFVGTLDYATGFNLGIERSR